MFPFRYWILTCVVVGLPQTASMMTYAQSNQLFTNQNQHEQEKPKKPVTLVLDLSSREIETLKEVGYVRTSIPTSVNNRVQAIRLKRQTSFLKEPHYAKLETDKLNRVVSLQVNDDVLERLDYQPVEIKLYESNYDFVVLTYKPKKRDALKTEGKPKLQLPNVFVRIDDERGVLGALENTKSFQFKTEFGNVEIPWQQISGIRFNAGGENQVFVRLKKGDVFSAMIDWNKIAIKTRWGNQELDVAKLESVTADRESRFAANTKGRYRLVTPLPLKLQIN